MRASPPIYRLGLATIRKEHVAFKNGKVVFDYPAKSGVRRVQTLDDPSCTTLIRMLRRRRRGAPELLAYRDGRRWASIRSDDINEYLKHQMGEDFSAKDFRTWSTLCWICSPSPPTRRLSGGSLLRSALLVLVIRCVRGGHNLRSMFACSERRAQSLMRAWGATAATRHAA